MNKRRKTFKKSERSSVKWDYSLLPDEIWFSILTKLDIKNVFKVQAVCKRIMNISASLEVFTKFSSLDWKTNREMGLLSLVNRFATFERATTYKIIGEYYNAKKAYDYTFENLVWFGSFTEISYGVITELSVNLDIGSLCQQLISKQKYLINVKSLKIISKHGYTSTFLSQTSWKKMSSLSVVETSNSKVPYFFEFKKSINTKVLDCLVLVIPYIDLVIGDFPKLKVFKIHARSIIRMNKDIDFQSNELKVLEFKTTNRDFDFQTKSLVYFSGCIFPRYMTNVLATFSQNITYVDLQSSHTGVSYLNELSMIKSLQTLRLKKITLHNDSVGTVPNVYPFLENLSGIRELELNHKICSFVSLNYISNKYKNLRAISVHMVPSVNILGEIESLEFLRILPSIDDDDLISISYQSIYDLMKMSLNNMKCLDIRKLTEINCKNIHKENANRKRNSMNTFYILFSRQPKSICEHSIHQAPEKEFDYDIFYDHSRDIEFPEQ